MGCEERDIRIIRMTFTDMTPFGNSLLYVTLAIDFLCVSVAAVKFANESKWPNDGIEGGAILIPFIAGFCIGGTFCGFLPNDVSILPRYWFLIFFIGGGLAGLVTNLIAAVILMLIGHAGKWLAVEVYHNCLRVVGKRRGRAFH